MDLTHEIPHLEQTSTARLFVGAWKLDQHISPIEARNDLARSVVINVPTCSKESPDNIGKLKNTLKYWLHEKREQITRFLPKKLNNVTPLLRKPEKV